MSKFRGSLAAAIVLVFQAAAVNAARADYLADSERFLVDECIQSGKPVHNVGQSDTYRCEGYVAEDLMTLEDRFRSRGGFVPQWECVRWKDSCIVTVDRVYRRR